MPYKSDIISDHFLKNQLHFDNIFKDIENMSIQRGFNILNNKQPNHKSNFYKLILNNLYLKEFK